jgi:predicted transcriptional regulator
LFRPVQKNAVPVAGLPDLIASVNLPLAQVKLPKHYPIVAPNYSATRSALAKTLGLERTPASLKKAAAKRKAKT